MATGKIEFIARGLLVRGDQSLLCRDVKHGYSYLPGGHVEFGESAEQALAREFMEEAAVEVSVGRPVLVAELRFVQRGRERHEVTIVFHVEQSPERAVTSVEPGIEFWWVGRAALSTASLRPAIVRPWLEGWRTGDPIAWMSADERV